MPVDKTSSTPQAASQVKSEPIDNVVTSKHSLKIGNTTLKYTATVGTVVLREEDDKHGHKAKAEVFFVAFTRDGVRDTAKRPLTFSFNGGPGSSSVWMLLGLLGPRRVPLGAENCRVAPPFSLQDNEHSLLLESDLVFIDPVGTGYSRPISGEDANPDEFYSFQRDLESVGEFIRLYTSRQARWSSPKYLIGESYGTTRATGLSGYLQERHGLFLNGIMLVSVVLNFQTLLFEPGNDLPYVMYLPSYAATGRHHKLLSKRLLNMSDDKFLDEVRAFAEGDYCHALMKGSRLTPEERGTIAGKLAEYTGLSEAYILGSNLRVEIMRFAKEIMRHEGRVVGRFDSRILGSDKDDVGENFENDPSFDVVQGVYSGCLNQYVRAELGFESDLPYEILSFKVFPKWKYDSFQNSFVNTADTLRKAINKNPHLKVFVANGLYDLATPFFATEYTFDHLGLRDDLQKNVDMAYYSAGHMMYMENGCLAALAKDLKKFVKSTR